MAQNMGFGSALTGFGTGYLNALKQGRSEQSTLLNAKLRKDALAQRKSEAAATNSLRSMQVADLLDARADRRQAGKDRAVNAGNKLLFGAHAKVSDFYTKMQPNIAAMNPEQRKTTHDSMRASVRGMLVAGGMDPKTADEQAESIIKPYGAALQDEMVDVSVGPDMSNEGLMSQGMVPQSSVDAQFRGAGPAPGTNTGFQLQPDGTYGRVGTHALDKPERSYLGMQNYLGDMGNNLFQTALGGRDPSGGRGFQQYQDPTIGLTEQRAGITKSVPAAATYGIDPKTQSLIEKNNAGTGLAKVRTEQLIKLFPDQAAFLKKRVEALGANIREKDTRTKFIGLNYDLEVRKLAAQTAHQKAMESIQSGQLSNAQQNTALRKIGLRLKSIIDPERILVNSAAIISDLQKARLAKDADKPAIDAQIARLQKEQVTMKALSHITDDPRKLSDMDYMAKIFAGQVGQMSPEMQTDVAKFGLSPSPYKMYDTMLGNSNYQNPFYDSEDWSEQDYMDNSALIPGFNGYAAAAAANGRPNPLLRNPRTQPNGGIPGFTR